MYKSIPLLMEKIFRKNEKLVCKLTPRIWKKINFLKKGKETSVLTFILIKKCCNLCIFFQLEDNKNNYSAIIKFIQNNEPLFWNFVTDSNPWKNR